MRKRHRSFARACFLAIAAAGTAAGADPAPSPDDTQSDREQSTVPTVIELFTSEGCSSCPPADRLASRLHDEARERDTDLIILGFHVDYWDYLGWKDPYSSRAATDRQRRYSAAWREDTIYTPQMIVNGAVGFVGSDAAKAGREVELAAAHKPEGTVSAELAWDPAGVSITVNAGFDRGLSPASGDITLLAAVVENDVESVVTRGENAGRTLRHDNVVRVFADRRGVDNAASLVLAVPAGVKPENASVVVLAQDQKTLKLLAAARLDYPPAKP